MATHGCVPTFVTVSEPSICPPPPCHPAEAVRSPGRQPGVPGGIATGVGEGAVRADWSSQGTIDPEGIGTSVARSAGGAGEVDGDWGVGLADGGFDGTAEFPHAATSTAQSSVLERAGSRRMVMVAAY